MSTNPQPLIATIYNPQNQSKDALIAGFIARKQKFERIFRDIRDASMTKPEQHYLIQGIRGMGKTTLLLRIAYEIENTPELRKRLIPIVFNEEEYGIGSLADVWERTAQYLGETDTSFANLYDAITKQYGQADYEKQALQTIINALQQQDKKLLLLIDNVGDVLKKLDTQEEQRLREVLLTTPELRLIGATSVVIEQVHDYTKPFYEFFKIIHLDGLSKVESIELFLKLGETYHSEAVQKLIERQPGRIEAIRRLTGGVIRTMVLLFEIMVENDSGSVFRDLEVLLDRVTPLYKHRMDDLPAQQQKIVAALATAWDAASTKELAQTVRLESKTVSAQLKQLINSGLVEKVETNTKNHLYRLEERFFNIWYLMRFGRKTDQRVLWLVRFFETMFEEDSEWFVERISNLIESIKSETIDGETALLLTTAYSELLDHDELQDGLVKITRTYLSMKSPELTSLLKESRQESIDTAINTGNYQTAIALLSKVKTKDFLTYYDIAICYALMNNETLTADYLFSSCIALASKLEDETAKAKKLVRITGTFAITATNTEHARKVLFLHINDLKAELTLRYLTSNIISRKNLCKSIVEESFGLSSKHSTFRILYNLIYLWDNDFTKIIKLNTEDFQPTPLQEVILEHFSDYSVDRLLDIYLKLLLAKKQYHTAYNYFQQEDWQLKDRFKPLYYATLYFLKDEYPTDYLRMGPELQETVDDVLAEVAKMAIDYA